MWCISKKSLIFTGGMSVKYFILFCFSLLLFTCIIAPEYSDIPAITFEGMDKNIVSQAKLKDDTLEIRIGFTDGDGDIGDPNNKANVFLLDDRDGNYITYSMPVIPQKGIANGVKGTITVYHTTGKFNVCCYFTNADACTIPDIATNDTVNYKLFIEDRKGNKSNQVKLPPLFIRCK